MYIHNTLRPSLVMALIPKENIWCNEYINQYYSMCTLCLQFNVEPTQYTLHNARKISMNSNLRQMKAMAFMNTNIIVLWNIS